jgi:hypothetical protein
VAFLPPERTSKSTVLCSSILACVPGVPPPVRYGHTSGRQGDRSEQGASQPRAPPARVRNTTSILLPSSLGAADHSSQQARVTAHRASVQATRAAGARAPIARCPRRASRRAAGCGGRRQAGAIGRRACERRSRESPARL